MTSRIPHFARLTGFLALSSGICCFQVAFQRPPLLTYPITPLCFFLELLMPLDVRSSGSRRAGSARKISTRQSLRPGVLKRSHKTSAPSFNLSVSLMPRIKPCKLECKKFWRDKTEIVWARTVIGLIDQAENLRLISFQERWLRRELKKKLLDLCSMERCMARQRARLTWLNHGDANTEYFLIQANHRWRKNFIGTTNEEAEPVCYQHTMLMMRKFCTSTSEIDLVAQFTGRMI